MMTRPTFARPSGDLHAPVDFDMLEPGAAMNSSTVRQGRRVRNECTFFRLNLHSNHAVSTAAGNTWTFQVNCPEELAQGRWMVAADSVVMSGNAAASTNANRICDVHLTGIPLRDNYDATPQQDSSLLASLVRGAPTAYWSRPITMDTVGVPLADLGQLRGRRITVDLRNGDGAPLGDNGLTHWRLSLVFWRLNEN